MISGDDTMSILRTALALVVAIALVAPAWAAEAKAPKKAEQQKKKEQKAKPAKQAAASTGQESTDKKVQGVVLRGIQRQVVEVREYTGLELKTEGTDEVIKLLVPFIEDATTKRLSVDREKLDQLARLRVGYTVAVTYYTDKDWNWIRSLEILDDGQDEDKDQAKDKKDANHNNRNNRNRDRNNRNRRNNNRDRNTGNAKPQPQNNQSKSSGPVPNPNNMNVPQKIAPVPLKIK